MALATACAAPATPPAASVSELSASAPEEGGQRRFDGLTFELELESGTVEAGARLRGQLVVENETGGAVEDPGCWLAASRSAIVPHDDPAAELWQQVIVDCSGPTTIAPGEDELHVLDFVAATKYGDPLPPGDYVAAVEYRGLSRRIEVPITVTE